MDAPSLQLNARQRLTAILVALLAVLVLGAINTWYINHVQAEGERRWRQSHHDNDLRWCRVLAIQVVAYREHPPQTETGQQIAREINVLHAQLGCPPA